MNENPQSQQKECSELPFQRLPDETIDAFEGFLTFFGLKGRDRKLDTVAELVGVHPSTVKNWSSEFQWRNRLHQYRLSLLASRSQAEAEAQKAHEMAKLERQRQEELEIEVFCRELRSMARQFYKEYTLNNLDKTRLDEITRLLLASVKLPKLAGANDAGKKAAVTIDPAIEQRYYDEIEKIYGQKADQLETLGATSTSPQKTGS